MNKVDIKLATPNGTMYETVEHGINGDNYLKCKKIDEMIEMEAKAENYAFPSRVSLELTEEEAKELATRLFQLTDE